METANHECYVSLEVAELLKEAGFDWYNCSHRYNDALKLSLNMPGRIYGGDYHCAAPTLDVAQRWLREVKGYYVVWSFGMNINSWGQELYDFTDISVYIFVDSEQGNICKCKLKENYKTIEEAQEEGIKRALELILEKGE